TGAGAGGSITLSSNSSQAFQVNVASAKNGTSGQLLADSGLTSGNGGVISVTNLGSGGVRIPSLSDVSAATLGSSGAGGTISLNAEAGPLSLGSGTLDVNAAALGNGNGGTIELIGTTVVVTGTTPAILSANGAGTGAGGTVRIRSSD